MRHCRGVLRLINLRDQQKTQVTLEGVRVTAKSDGGLSLQPDPDYQRTHPVFSIEVPHLFPLHIFIFCRRSEKNTTNATTKRHIKCMPHKYMPKCSAKSVTAPATHSPKTSKRLSPLLPSSNLEIQLTAPRLADPGFCFACTPRNVLFILRQIPQHLPPRDPPIWRQLPTKVP